MCALFVKMEQQKQKQNIKLALKESAVTNIKNSVLLGGPSSSFGF